MSAQPCLAEATLAEWLSGGLVPEAVARVEEHIDSCSSCFRMLTEVARTTMGSGASALGSRPGVVLDHSFGEVPRQIEEYCLLRRVGQGAMGQVFLAIDTRLDRPVAIKLLAALPHASARERFLVEARAVARLSHPNVVTIHRVGELHDHPYLVYEYVRGRSLDAIERPLPWRRALELARGLARGLAAAHRAGVLHRDIKPANAILGDDGTVKLLDFGLAKMVGAREHELAALPPARASTPEPSLTTTGALMGTPLYMAPEAWEGAAPTPSMDVYSLGAIVHELCTGVPVHKGRTFEELRAQVRTQRAAPLASLVPGVAPGLARVIDRCLARAPEERPASAEELCRELEAVAQELDAPPPRRRRALLASLLVMGALLSAVVLGKVLLRPGGHERPVRAAHADAREPRACSADHWCWDTRVPAPLARVWAQAPDNVWAVGARGTMRHFDGHSWQDVDSGTVADLRAVHGSAADDVWVVGDWSTVLHWDGKRWETLQLRTKTLMTDVLAIARDDVWMVGDRVALHWDGKLWTPAPIPAVAILNRLAARASDDVWAVGEGGMVLHWDGQRWTQIDTQSDEFLTSIRIVSKDELWIAGFRGFVRRRVGDRWLDVDLPLTKEHRWDFWINDIWTTGADDIWLMTKREPLLHWDGHTWSFSDPHSPREFATLSGTGRDDLWAVSTTDVIVHWDGTSWAAPDPRPPFRQFTAVWGAAPDDLWAVGYEAEAYANVPRHGVIRRFDGRAWHPFELPNSPVLHAVWGTRADDVWVAGEHGMLAHWDGQALRTVDAGTSAELFALAGSGANDVWVAGAKGTVLSWDGRAWTSHASGTAATLRGLWADPAGDDVWAVGDKGAMVRRHGGAWAAVASGTSWDLHGLWGAHAGDVWAVGQMGTALHFDGKAWSSVYSDTPEDIHAVSGSGPDDIWAVTFMFHGVQGSMVHWNGKFWSVVRQTPRMGLFGVTSLAPDDVWAAGGDEMLLHYEPPGR